MVGYGAPGKGNTLLNYCGIRTDLIDFTVDRNPYKHGRMLPGSRIPVLPPERLDSARPDYVLILPWNLREEIMQQLGHVRSLGWSFYRADSGAGDIDDVAEIGDGPMKVVLFCGGEAAHAQRPQR